MSKKTILDGHKKVGKKFIAPMMQLSNMASLSYVEQILPQIIWMGLINDLVGYKQGTQIVVRITEILKDVKDEEKFLNFTMMSSFSDLSDEIKNDLIKKLTDESLLPIIQKALAPLTQLYDTCPLSFLNNSIPSPRSVLISQMKSCVYKHADKYKTPALIILANVIYSLGVTGRLFISQNIKVPDLNALIEAPDSEEAKHAAGFVRSSALNQFMMVEKGVTSTIWSESFWNQSYKLDACEFNWEKPDE